MRDILELCVQMDGLAHGAYRAMADSCTDPDVAEVMAEMGAEEARHIEWWRELATAWDRGLLPDIYADGTEARSQLAEILESLRSAIPAGNGERSGDECLRTAVGIEFFMLDPMFGELLDLAEPALSRSRHEAYSRHIERLIAAVEQHYHGDEMSQFLARVLRRSWRENRRLAAFAMRDPLTGLANRRAFGTQLRQWAAWSARYGRPLTVALLDIDEFKRINDEHGHAAGDAMLSSIARALARVLRASDMAARYGGDEFAVLAPEAGPEEARGLGERILTAVRGAEVLLGDGRRVRATTSVGLTVVIDPPDSEPRSADELLAHADQALYAAKRAGRDRMADPVLLTREF